MVGITDTATVLAMLSPDVDDCAVDGETVADTLPAKRRSPHYPGLLTEIARDGITVPVVIRRDPAGNPWLMEGHHRVAAAVDLGMSVVPWTDVPLDVDHGACYQQMRSPWSGYATAPA